MRLLDAATIHGVVFSSNSELELPHCASVLFLKSPQNGLEVENDGLIPLSRSLLGMPLHSKFNVEVSLQVDGHDYTTIVTFDTKEKGEDIEFIVKDKKKRILVKVTWLDIGHLKDLIPQIYDCCPLSQVCISYIIANAYKQFEL